MAITPVFTNPVVGPIHDKTWPRPAASHEFKITATLADHLADHRPGGIDIGNGHCGDPVLAMASGKVSMAGLLGAAKTVRIVHPQFPGYETGATHLATITVKVGQTVTQGQQIGTHGMTGADACHLHQGCKFNGVEVDWLPFLVQNRVGGDNMPQLTKWEPGKASIKAGAVIRSSPSMADAAKRFVVGPKGSSASTFIGWVRGALTSGSDLWGVYFIPTDGTWAYTHKINIVSVTPLIAGFTQDQLLAAAKTGRIDGIKAAAARAAATV